MNYRIFDVMSDHVELRFTGGCLEVMRILLSKFSATEAEKHFVLVDGAFEAVMIATNGVVVNV